LAAREPIAAGGLAPVWREVLFPLGLGIALGALASYDHPFGPYHPLWRFAVKFDVGTSWLWSASALLLLMLAVATYRSRYWLFEHRFQVAVVLLIVPGTINGLNIGRLDPFEFCVAALTLFWIGLALLEHRPILTPKPVITLLAALMVCGVSSMINGRQNTLFFLPGFVAKLAVVFLATNLIATPALLRMALKTLLTVAVVSALIAIASEIIYVTTGYAFTTVDAPKEWFKSTPLGNIFRVVALNRTPQMLGHLMILGLALAICMPTTLPKRLLLFAPLSLALVLTLSAGAIVSGLLVVALSPFMLRPSGSLHFVICYVSAGLVAYLTGLLEWIFRTLLLPLAIDGIELRLQFIRIGWEALERYPVLGTGLNNYGRVDSLYPIHNAYLQMMAEMGILSGILFLSLIAYVTISCAVIVRRSQDSDLSYWLKGLVLGMVGIGAHMLAEPFYMEVLPWVYIGLLASAVTVYRQPRWL
jgi:hypothetical protein